VHQAKTSEAPRSGPCPSEIGNEELVGIAHDDVADLTASVDQESDLTSDLSRELRQSSSELGSDESVGWAAAPIERLERLGCALLQPLSVAMQGLDENLGG